MGFFFWLGVVSTASLILGISSFSEALFGGDEDSADGGSAFRAGRMRGATTSWLRLVPRLDELIDMRRPGWIFGNIFPRGIWPPPVHRWALFYIEARPGTHHPDFCPKPLSSKNNAFGRLGPAVQGKIKESPVNGNHNIPTDKLMGKDGLFWS